MSGTDGGGLAVGQRASIAKTITEADVLPFAAVSLDAKAGKASSFRRRVAHGMLSAGQISAVLGAKLPGLGAVHLGQTLKFRTPVRIGGTVTATAEALTWDAGSRRATLRTTCTVAGKVVIEGEAMVLLPAPA